MQDKIEKSIALDAPIARVWRALTDHVEFGEWFQVKLDSPFVVGEISRGQITYSGSDYQGWLAKVHTMETEKLFSFSWLPCTDAPESEGLSELETLVEFKLESTASGTHLVVVESGFSAIPESSRSRIFQRNDAGWAEQMKNIKRHVNG